MYGEPMAGRAAGGPPPSHAESALSLLNRPGRFEGVDEDDDPREDTSWLIIYLDVITAVLTLFIVLLAFTDLGPLAARQDPPPEATPATRPELDTRLLAEVTEDVDIIVEPNRINFRIRDGVLFPSGSAALADSGRGVLDSLIPVLAGNDHRISVEGHTDDVPIATERFPSNWELSTGRAASVLRYLTSRGIEDHRLSATGFAQTRPIGDNATAEGRAQNRRVMLILHMDEGDRPQ